MPAARILIITLIGLSTAACTATFPTEPTFPAQVADLVIHYPTTGTKAVAGFNENAPRFEAYTIDSDGVWASVTSRATWTSSDIAALTPSTTSPGVFSTFRVAGRYEIYALYQGRQAVLTVDVRAVPPFPYLELSSVSGFSPIVRVRTNSSAGTQITSGVTWSSSDERIATIDSRGVVTPLAPGNVRIIGTYEGLSDFFWRSVPPRQ